MIDRDGSIVASGIGLSELDMVTAIDKIIGKFKTEAAWAKGSSTQPADAAQSDGGQKPPDNSGAVVPDGTPKAPGADTVNSILPGEMRLTGSVIKDDTGEASFLLSATSIQLPGGEMQPFTKARVKKIDVVYDTRLSGAGTTGVQSVHLRAGAHISVIGKDQGIGKELTARVIEMVE